MKNTKLRLLKAVITSTCLAVGSANAATVLWMTELSEVNADWNNFLTNAGYTVTGYVDAGSNPNPDAVGAPFTVAELNAFDLIIAGGSNVSGSGGASLEFHGNVWNTVTTPLIHMGAFGVDGRDWNWFGGNGNGVAATGSYDNTDPIFGSIDPTDTPLFTADTRTGNTVINKDGTILAADTNGAIQLARWATGDAADGPRAFFAGLRTNTANARDNFILTPEGETVFLNLANEFSAIPEPSTALLAGIGLLALLRRRR